MISQSRTCLVKRGSLLGLGCALGLAAATAWAAAAAPPPPPPQTDDCSGGSSSSSSGCPASSNSGVTQTGVTNTSIFLTNTLSSSAGGFGNSLTGGFTAAPGVARYALGADTGKAGAAGGTRWNVWLAAAQSQVAYNFAPLQSGGHIDVGLGGVDYTFGGNVILGVALSGERTRIGTSYNGGNLRGNGNTVAPYLAWAITRSWVLDASLGYGRTTLDSTDNSIAGGVTGSTRDRRSFGSLGLSYNHIMGKWQFTGKGLVLSAEDKIGAYTLSNSTAVPGLTSRTTQARLGAQAAYNAGTVVPYFGITYIYDMQHPNQTPVGGQNAANDRDGIQLQAGLNFQSKGPFYGGISVMSEQGRRQVKNDQVLLNLGWRF